MLCNTCSPADEIKFAWKIQRDMAERGHSLESIKVLACCSALPFN